MSGEAGGGLFYPDSADEEAEAVIVALRGDLSGEPCSDCGDTPTVADAGGSSKRYCRVDAGHRMARGEDVTYDENPADGEAPRTETDCQGSGIYDCPCEANGPDGLCSCCRSGESNGSCGFTELTVTAGKEASDAKA